MTQRPIPATKDGYRYYYSEDDELLCGRYIKEINFLDPSKRIHPAFTKRLVISPVVKLSENDRAIQLKLNDACTRVTGEKGYSMVRATHGINRGKFYYEVYIDSMPEGTAARIGWGQCYSNLQAPLGYDSYGYSYRSRFGTKFHQAKGKTFDLGGGYGKGDTIGCMIELPFGNPQNQTEAHHLPVSIKVSGWIISLKKKDAKVLEKKDEPPPLNEVKPLVGSKISFYKNGRLVGVAFEDILEGFYYPSISLYKSCTVTPNFGPRFRYPPEKFNDDSKIHIGYQPANDMAEISIIDNLLSDLLYVVENETSETGRNLLEEKTKSSNHG